MPILQAYQQESHCWGSTLVLVTDYGMPPKDPSVEDTVPRMVLSVSDGTYRQMCTLQPLVGGSLRGIVGLQSLSLLLLPG